MAPDSRLGLSCPMGGRFYLCLNSSVRFLGCCVYDPCEDGSGHCQTNSLRPTGYDIDNGDLIKPQQCEVDSDSANRQMQWYRCEKSNPPYFNCCSRNTCYMGQGCPNEYLTAVVLSDDPVAAAPFLGQEIPVDGNGTFCGNGTTGHGTSRHTDSKDYNEWVRYIEIGVPVAAVIVLLILFAVYYCLQRKRKRDREDAGLEMGNTSQPASASSTEFTNPRPAPRPPSSIPPVLLPQLLPLPPLPPEPKSNLSALSTSVRKGKLNSSR
ncbi:hypothetical protein GGS21DRAFT_501404 [Xylaria nigripes]|nr:hypothetical protein GGS21DRAFT_501404 [Xylaria nigripes]